ncbi:MAG: hypothetical protein H0U08_06395, partial [Actinobacteria bacterium]|nr:hypothetical protein [Actinomycetota bacterium]
PVGEIGVVAVRSDVGNKTFGLRYLELTDELNLSPLAGTQQVTLVASVLAGVRRRGTSDKQTSCRHSADKAAYEPVPLHGYLPSFDRADGLSMRRLHYEDPPYPSLSSDKRLLRLCSNQVCKKGLDRISYEPTLCSTCDIAKVLRGIGR